MLHRIYISRKCIEIRINSFSKQVLLVVVVRMQFNCKYVCFDPDFGLLTGTLKMCTEYFALRCMNQLHNNTSLYGGHKNYYNVSE